MRSLLLIRHGQASFRAADYDRLSEVGAEQSRRLGAWLAECGEAPDIVVTGPRQRHLRTATECMRATGVDSPLLRLDGLDEVDHEALLSRLRPDLASRDALRHELKQSPDPYRAFQQLFAAAVERWTDGAHDGDYLITWPQFRRNVLEALDTLEHYAASTIWAFTSGGPIAVIANRLLGAPAARAFTLSWPLVNTSVTRLRLGKRGPSLVTYNAWPHLQRRQDQHLVTLR